MAMYKVWSMSSGRKELEFRLEHEARIRAQTRIEAIEKAMCEVKKKKSSDSVESWAWMATPLP